MLHKYYRAVKERAKMELKQDEIIKALECCISDKCEFCPYAGMPTTIVTCGLFAKGKALSLIKALIEENDRLKAELANRPHKLIITKKKSEDTE